MRRSLTPTHNRPECEDPVETETILLITNIVVLHFTKLEILNILQRRIIKIFSLAVNVSKRYYAPGSHTHTQ